MKKQKIRFNSGDGVIVFIIRDESGAKQEVFTSNISDKKNLKKISHFLYAKYDIDLSIKGQEKGFFDF